MHGPTLARIASLLGDVSRASMLEALMDGRALTAGELARAANVTPATASAHLAKLADARLVKVARQGRHRYHALASAEVAALLEAACRLPVHLGPAAVPVTGPRDAAMREARTCYDHLAGRLAVAVADSMVARGLLELDLHSGRLTDAGGAFLCELGVRVTVPARRRAPSCRPCLDWSERRPHLAGLLGRALLDRFLALDWLRRRPGSRSLCVTGAGRAGFASRLGIRADVMDGASSPPGRGLG